jgi:hypothetical protein
MALLPILAVLASSAVAPYKVKFDVQLASGGVVGDFVIEVHPEWAPLGAARFRELIDAEDGKFFKGVR